MTHNSLVEGHVVSVRDVAGDVRLSFEQRQYRYWCAPFPKLRSLTREEAAARPAQVLFPGHEIVPLVGRDVELDELMEWLHGSNSFSVQLVHADGGHGKTRLADSLRQRAAGKGWVAWRAVHTVETVDQSAAITLTDSQSLLLLVDDAHRWPVSTLQSLLVNLHALTKTRPEITVRLLLLTRTVGMWWPALTASLREWDIPHRVTELAPLGFRANRTHIFDTAVTAFRETLLPPPPPQVRRRGPAELRAGLDLTGSQYDSVLAIHMAALCTAFPQGSTTNVANTIEFTSYLIDSEYAEWTKRRAAGLISIRPETMRRVAYVATLTHGLLRSDARIALIAIGLARDEVEADVLIDDYGSCYPANDTVLSPLQPDRLAEDFLALMVPGAAVKSVVAADNWVVDATHKLLLHSYSGAPPAWVITALATLIEAAGRWSHLTHVLYPVLAGNPLIAADSSAATLIQLAELPAVPTDVVQTLCRHLHEHPSPGTPAALVALDVVLLPQQIAETTDPAEQADLYARYALQLAQLSRYEQASEASRQAIHLYRRLAEADSDTYLVILASALVHLAVQLRGSGQRRQALAPAEETVAIRRRLVEADVKPETHIPALAEALTHLSVHLAEAGLHREALTPAQESVARWRDLVESAPDVYLPGLAKSLSNLGARMQDVGRPRDALVSAEESVAVWRSVVDADPSTPLAALAEALTNLGIQLGVVGRHTHALRPIEEAVAIFRRLAAADSRDQLSNLASVLGNAGISLWEAGRYQEALASAKESVEIWRTLIRGNPAAHLPGLARSLNNLGIQLWRAGRAQESLLPMEEAVTIRRRLVEASPDANLFDLASCLGNFGLSLARAGRTHEALTQTEEAVAMFRRLVEADPDRHMPNLAKSLANLSERLRDEGRYQEALAPAEESVAMWRKLIEDHPDTYLSDMAGSLDLLGARLGDVGRYQEALAPAEESVAMWRKLIEADSNIYHAELANALRDYARITSQAETQVVEGFAASAEAVELFQRLAEQIPGAYEEHLIEARASYSSLLRLCASPPDTPPTATTHDG